MWVAQTVKDAVYQLLLMLTWWSFTFFGGLLGNMLALFVYVCVFVRACEHTCVCVCVCDSVSRKEGNLE